MTEKRFNIYKSFPVFINSAAKILDISIRATQRQFSVKYLLAEENIAQNLLLIEDG